MCVCVCSCMHARFWARVTSWARFPFEDILVSFDYQLDTVYGHLRGEPQLRKCLDQFGCGYMCGELPFLLMEAQTTVGRLVSWACGAELYEKITPFISVYKPASSIHRGTFQASLVWSQSPSWCGTVWNSNEACLPSGSCLPFLNDEPGREAGSKKINLSPLIYFWSEDSIPTTERILGGGVAIPHIIEFGRIPCLHPLNASNIINCETQTYVQVLANNSWGAKLSSFKVHVCYI